MEAFASDRDVALDVEVFVNSVCRVRRGGATVEVSFAFVEFELRGGAWSTVPSVASDSFASGAFLSSIRESFGDESVHVSPSSLSISTTVAPWKALPIGRNNRSTSSV